MIFFTAHQYEYDEAMNPEIGSHGMTEEDCEIYDLSFHNGGLSDLVLGAEDRIGFYDSQKSIEFLKKHELFKPILESVAKAKKENSTNYEDGLHAFEFNKEARKELTDEYLKNNLEDRHVWEVESIIELIDSVIEQDRIFCIVSG